MQTKMYTSYAQIDSELEILKLEKEISHQRLILGFRQTRESLTPSHLMSSFLASIKNSFTGSYATVLNIAVPLVIKWIINRKRGS
jgi:hypothetical protein